MPDATPSKRAALKTIFAKLTKLIPHFANDNDSEALAALRKATRLLASAKLDWHDLTMLLAGEPQSVLELLAMLLGMKDVDLFYSNSRAKKQPSFIPPAAMYTRRSTARFYPSLQQREDFTIGYGTHSSPRKSAPPPLRP